MLRYYISNHHGNYVCGDQVDVLDNFAANEKLLCKDDVESCYYSSLVDGTANLPLVCYSCGVQLDVKMKMVISSII